ncbi:MAG: hypothetical protein JSS32_07595 [Verrucomicrobia bacterium]|nr:hypothetical protein [Verrucomicrobiota bacterium]
MQDVPVVRIEIEKRWETFQTQRSFSPFRPGKSDEELRTEHEKIDQIRYAVWKKPDYEIAQHLIDNDLIRAADAIAFNYNNTVPYYNCSTIYIGDRYYIAAEGPRSKDIPKFFELLSSQNVTHLVRLTGAYEGWIPKCAPYWDGLVKESEGKTYLDLPGHSVRLFHLDFWKDHHGIDPSELLKVALQIKEDLQTGLLLVHCSAGVGRTGTFLASMAAIDAIDRGQPFSIEEIVYRLSLQRIFSVYSPVQYITVHRLAEAYLKQKGS